MDRKLSYIEHSMVEASKISEAANPDKEYLALAKGKTKELEAEFTKEVLAAEKKFKDDDDLQEEMLDQDGWLELEERVFKKVFGTKGIEIVAWSGDSGGNGTAFDTFVNKLADKVIKKVSRNADMWEVG